MVPASLSSIPASYRYREQSLCEPEHRTERNRAGEGGSPKYTAPRLALALFCGTLAC